MLTPHLRIKNEYMADAVSINMHIFATQRKIDLLESRDKRVVIHYGSQM